MTSTVITGATIFDGSGEPGFVGDLLIADGQITSVGEVPTSPDAHIIDGSGLCVAPGFIDVHTHDDYAAIVHPDMAFKNRGGVTTCIVGNCGFGAAPVEAARTFAEVLHPGFPLPDYDGYGGYMSYLEEHPTGVNIGVLAGHGTIRAAVLNDEAGFAREPTDAELASMTDLLTEALDAGVLGLSSGLVYEPGCHANTEELIALASVMSGTCALYASHVRDEGDHLVESIAEAIEIGRAAAVPVQLSHHKATGTANWGKVRDSLALIDAARAEGLRVHADQYPYTAGSTSLDSVAGNYRIVEGAALDGSTISGDNLVVASCEAETTWEGRTMNELAEEFGCSPSEAAQRVLSSARTTTVILHVMSEDDVRTVMAHDSTIIGSDGLPTLDGKPHPRLYNTFARVLGHYSRDIGVLPLAEAIARMTGRSADAFGLADRGYLRPGYAADVVVFDAELIIDRGTFADPNRYPDGIRHVFVNGVEVVGDGQPTGTRPGQVLRRSDG